MSAVSERDIVSQVPMVKAEVRRYCRKLFDKRWNDDIESFAMEVLCTSAGAYDPLYGVPWPVYVKRRVRGAMADEYRRQQHSRSQHRVVVYPLYPMLTEMEGRRKKPTRGEMNLTGFGECRTSQFWRMVEALSDQADIEESVVEGDLDSVLGVLGCELTDRERSILGKIALEGKSYPEIGKDLGMNESTVFRAVRQVKARAA